MRIELHFKMRIWGNVLNIKEQNLHGLRSCFTFEVKYGLDRFFTCHVQKLKAIIIYSNN